MLFIRFYFIAETKLVSLKPIFQDKIYRLSQRILVVFGGKNLHFLQENYFILLKIKYLNQNTKSPFFSVLDQNLTIFQTPFLF